MTVLRAMYVQKLYVNSGLNQYIDQLTLTKYWQIQMSLADKANEVADLCENLQKVSFLHYSQKSNCTQLNYLNSENELRDVKEGQVYNLL